MERLTFEGNFCDIAQCRERPCPYDGSCTQRLVWERLKAYEDSGLSPQACAQASEIEKQLDSYGFSAKKCWSLSGQTRTGGWWCCRARWEIQCGL